MPRVPDEIIQSLKVNTSMLTLAGKYGLEPKKKGTKGYMAICPFHQVDGRPESQPSLSISPEKNVYHCFSCNAGGDPIRFVMDFEKKTLPEAVDVLLAMKPHPTKPDDGGRAAKGKTQPAQMSEAERSSTLAEVMRNSTEMLRNNKIGREYLENRGLDHLTLAVGKKSAWASAQAAKTIDCGHISVFEIFIGSFVDGSVNFSLGFCPDTIFTVIRNRPTTFLYNFFQDFLCHKFICRYFRKVAAT